MEESFTKDITKFKSIGNYSLIKNNYAQIAIPLIILVLFIFFSLLIATYISEGYNLNVVRIPLVVSGILITTCIITRYLYGYLLFRFDLLFPEDSKSTGEKIFYRGTLLKAKLTSQNYSSIKATGHTPQQIMHNYCANNKNESSTFEVIKDKRTILEIEAIGVSHECTIGQFYYLIKDDYKYYLLLEK